MEFRSPRLLSQKRWCTHKYVVHIRAHACRNNSNNNTIHERVTTHESKRAHSHNAQGSLATFCVVARKFVRIYRNDDARGCQAMRACSMNAVWYFCISFLIPHSDAGHRCQRSPDTSVANSANYFARKQQRLAINTRHTLVLFKVKEIKQESDK